MIHRASLFCDSTVLIITVILCLGAGCSSVFYQPSQILYNLPETSHLKYKDVFFESIDGTPLHAWHIFHRQDKPFKGTIVQFHGNAENISSFFAMLAWVTHHGYDLFTFDYRGYGRSAGSPSQKGVNFDAVTALIYAQDLWKKKQTPAVIVYGQSIGGAIVLRALQQINDKSFIKAVVIDSSFVNYKSLAREKLAGVFLTWPLQWLAYPLISNEYSPRDAIDTLSPVPLLVIHGDQDEVVPLHHGREIFDRAKEPKTFWEIKGGQHIDSMVGHGGLYRDRLMAFLDGLKPRSRMKP